MFEEGWNRGGINSLSYAFTDFFSSQAANSTAAEFTRQKIREIVRDPDVAETLCPYQHIGTKRTCVDIDYFQTYNRDNVHLIDLRREAAAAAHAVSASGPTQTNTRSTASCSRSGSMR